MEFLSLEQIQEIAHHYGYWAIFLGIGLESTGIPLPGETITLVGGFLAGSGELNYWGVLGSAIAGAAIGDNIGYWVGKTGGWSLLLKIGTLLGFSESQLEQMRTKFAENAAKAVFFGRFIALLRIFAGPLAGIANMPYQLFLLCNLAGATIWGLIMVTLSYMVGHIIGLETLVSSLLKFGILALLLLIVITLVPSWIESKSNQSS